MERSAVISPCKTYRYELRRHWNPRRPRLVYVMLNPSTADANNNDQTVLKCIGFADRWGFGGFTIVNLFAYRATDPDRLFAIKSGNFDVVGPRNDEFIKAAISQVDFVVAAWGERGGPTLRALEVTKMMPESVKTIKRTRKGHPAHPLMLPYSLNPKTWVPPSITAK